MATTANFNLWSPDDGDDWDLTIDLAAMQNSVDLALVGLRSSIGKTAATIAALGSGAFAGQIGWVTSAGAYVVWSGSAWVAPRGQRVASAAARGVLYPSPSNGDMTYRTDLAAQTFYTTTSPAGWVREVVQSGSIVPAAGVASTVTFPTAFRAVPALNSWVSDGGNVCVPHVRLLTATNFTVSNWTVTGGSVGGHTTVWNATGLVNA